MLATYSPFDCPLQVLGKLAEMNLLNLLSSTQALRPASNDQQLIRLMLVMLVSNQQITEESLPECLIIAEQSMRMIEDQTAAVAEELDSVALSQPSEFSPSHIWTLLKAIRVQKQMFDLYDSTFDSELENAPAEPVVVVCESSLAQMM